MTNADKILAALQTGGPLTDEALRKRTGVEPHQQVNQICRRLEAQGLLRRTRGSDGRIVNTLVGDATSGIRHSSPDSQSLHDEPLPPGATTTAPPAASQARPGRDLFVIQCSRRKAPGGQPGLGGRSVTGLLGEDLAERLLRARAALRPKAQLDDSRLLPALQRYTGTLYLTAGDAIRQATESGSPLVIISGGYGVLLPDEPIGIYDRELRISDWPPNLLEECLVALSKRMGAERVLAFCARSTDYARLVRRVRWRQAGTQATLVSPDMRGRGGAQVLVPRGSGEALGEALSGRLASGWTSSDGVTLRTEVLA